MKKSILRLFVTTFLLALALGLVISTSGWLLGWNTFTQFSNGLFMFGGIIVMLGLLSVTGGYTMRSDGKLLYAQSAGDMNLEERTRRMVTDMKQGYHVSLFLFLTGGFLIGMAILVGSVL